MAYMSCLGIPSPSYPGLFWCENNLLPHTSVYVTQKEIESASWMDMVWCHAMEDSNRNQLRVATWQAVDLVLVELVLCLIAQSAGFMYRCVMPRLLK